MEKENTYTEIISLLIEAINNRTRERNFFRLYAETLDKNNCSFENLPGKKQQEFCSRISHNEDDYVIQSDLHLIVLKEAMEYLINHRHQIKDIEDFTDLCDLIGVQDKKEMEFIDSLKGKNKYHKHEINQDLTNLEEASVYAKEKYETKTYSNVDNIDLKNKK